MTQDSIHIHGFQIRRDREEQDLAIVHEFVALGWEVVAKFALGNDVYMINLYWPKNEPKVYPAGYRL